ncbi:hypothetical protein BJ684DRAFT_1400, partial [Piptocephalis cylindrospora]
YVTRPSAHLCCPICHAPFLSPVTTPCGHTFCRGCILQSLTFTSACPIDRSPLQEAQLGPTMLIVQN